MNASPSGAGLLAGRVAIVTGAGRGIGRAHALALSAEGARVVVNDLGTGPDGIGSSAGPAREVVEVISANGGDALMSTHDVSDWSAAEALVQAALERFGQLDILVNNAGVLRDRMLVNMTESEWDDVLAVNLKGTAAMTRAGAVYWRARSKEGKPNDARVINTSSASGLYGNQGQANYGAAKAGVAAFTVICAMELARYGVTVNAIAPAALTRLTQDWPGAQATASGLGEFDETDPANISPAVVWLASTEAASVTGRVFNVRGGRISVAEGWHAGPVFDKGARLEPKELGPVIKELLSRAAPNADMRGLRPGGTPAAGTGANQAG